MPYFSVIVPTYNRLARLRRVIAALERQTVSCQDFEVIVVSDGSTDGTADYLALPFVPLRLTPVLQANQGVAAARNAGVRKAEGEVVVFLDDDVVPAPEWLAEHARAREKHGDVIVLGPMLSPADYAMQPWVRWEQMMLMKQYADMISARWEPTARQFYTGNTSLARRHVVEAGGFDASFRRAEDVELAYRLAGRGLQFVFNPKAIGWHYAERSFASWLNIPYTYGRNDVIFCRDKGQTWLLPAIFTELRGRNPLIRLLAWTCLDRPRLSEAAVSALRIAGAAGLSRVAYSGIFNLRHYQGVADELGGRREFWRRYGEERQRTK